MTTLKELNNMFEMEQDNDIFYEKYINYLKENVKKIDKPRYLYHSSYYDGPLSGMCVIDDKEYWFYSFYEDSFYIDNNGVKLNITTEEADERNDVDYVRPRYFVCLEMTEKFKKIENKCHEAFSILVGTHCDYNEDNKRKLGNVDGLDINAYYSSEFIRDILDSIKNDYLDFEIKYWYSN